MKKVSFYTLGCKVNQYETNAMTQKFQEAGYEIVNMSEGIADIYIVNTCTVTNMSDRKSRQVLRKVKEKNKNAIVIAVGCYAQVSKKELEEMSYNALDNPTLFTEENVTFRATVFIPKKYESNWHTKSVKPRLLEFTASS